MCDDFNSQLAVLAGADHVVRGSAAGDSVRAFAATTRQTVQAARDAHETSPVVTAALGRLLTAGAMMGAMLKDEGELISLMVRGDGPLRGLTVTADALGHVKGYAGNPDVWIPLNKKGKLDVAAAVGQGTLTVVQDQPWGEPYTSQLSLFTGEIGDDIAAYYAESEQIPTAVGVGVLVDTDLSVRQAGGFIVQALPDCPEEVLSKLEANVNGMQSVTELLESGLTPADILDKVLDGLDFKPYSAKPVNFQCNCSRERTSRMLISLGEKELAELVDEGKPAELVCNFCSKKYEFSVEELKGLLEEVRAQKAAKAGEADGAGAEQVEAEEAAAAVSVEDEGSDAGEVEGTPAK